MKKYQLELTRAELEAVKMGLDALNQSTRKALGHDMPKEESGPLEAFLVISEPLETRISKMYHQQ